MFVRIKVDQIDLIPFDFNEVDLIHYKNLGTVDDTTIRVLINIKRFT